MNLSNTNSESNNSGSCRHIRLPIPGMFLCFILSLIFTVSCQNKKMEPNNETHEVSSEANSVEKVTNLKPNAMIEIVDKSLTQVLDTSAAIEILADGHDWSEGPLWLTKQKKLIYSDIPRNTIYSWSEEEGKKEYLSPSGFTGENFSGSEPGSNGLTLNLQGELVLCQHGNRVVAKMIAPLNRPQPSFQPLTKDFEGKKFNSPNDVIFDSEGNMYFTDPPYGLPKQMNDPGKEIDFQGVYRVTPDGEVTLLVQDMSRPNGLALSPDEKTLYVANSDPEKAIWMAFELDEKGTVKGQRLFFDATEWVSKEKGLPDGLKIDDGGNVFATGPGGVWVFDPEGKHLGTIKTGEATANCAFNEDKSVLFMTADAYLLRIAIK